MPDDFGGVRYGPLPEQRRIADDGTVEYVTPAEAAAAVDTTLEEAIEVVLVRYGVPLRLLIRTVVAGRVEVADADRGDFASDLAAVARRTRRLIGHAKSNGAGEIVFSQSHPSNLVGDWHPVFVEVEQ